MSDIWYSNKYEEYKDINPLVILLGAMIWETKKKEFKKIVRNKLMDKDIGKTIEEEVLEMNSRLNFTPTYYDAEECRKQEWAAEIKEAAREAAREAAEKATKEATEKTKAQSILDFYNNGAPLDIIKKYSGLKEEEINNIINNQKKKK